MKEDVYDLVVTIYLLGDQMDPDSVASKLGISPSRSHKKGARISSSSGREGVERTSLWCITAKTKSKTASDHLAELRALLPPNVNFLTLGGVEDAYLDILFLGSYDDHPSNKVDFVLSQSELMWLSSSGLSLQVTASFGPD